MENNYLNNNNNNNNNNKENDFLDLDINFEEADNFSPQEDNFSFSEKNFSQPKDFSQPPEPEPEKIIPPSQLSYNYPLQSSTQPFPSSSRESKHILAKIIIAILSLLIIGGIGMATTLATRIWDPLWNPFRPDPETVIQTMLEKMKNLNSYHTETNAEVLLKNKSEYKLKAQIWTNEDKTNLKNEFDLENLKNETGLNINFAMEGMEFSFAGEIKQIGKVFYFKLKTIPAAPFFVELFEELGIDFNNYKNVWIKFDQESITERFKEFMDPEDYKKLKEEQKKSLEKQQKLVKEILEKFEGIKLFLLKEELPDEKIGNKNFYHYVVLLNKEELKEKILELFKIISQELLKEEESKIFEEDFKEFSKDFNNFFDKIGDIQAHLWIGKKDNYLYKIKFEKTIDLFNLDPEEFKQEDKISLKIDINYSKFNEPIPIEEPKDYKKFEDIFYEFFKKLFENLNQTKKQAQIYAIFSNLAQIRNVAELIYEKENYSYKNLCLKNNLNTNNRFFGKELKILQESIAQNQGGPLNLRCYSSNNSYCIEANLPSLEEKLCMDSSGVFRQIPINYKCIGGGTLKNPYRCPVVSFYNLPKTPQEKPGVTTYLQSSLINSIMKLFKK